MTEYFPEDVWTGETCLKAVITNVSKQVQTRLEILCFRKVPARDRPRLPWIPTASVSADDHTWPGYDSLSRPFYVHTHHLRLLFFGNITYLS